MPMSERPRAYRKGSVFGDGRRSQLDGNARARFHYKLRAFARSGRLPAKQEWVGATLLKRLGQDGWCDPSHETLAEHAGCSARTAQRATATMRDLGLIRWQTRLKRSTVTGWQTHQTSNAYELTPDVPNPAIAHGRQSGGGTHKKVLKTVAVSILKRAGKEEADREREMDFPEMLAWTPPQPRNPASHAAMVADNRAKRHATRAERG